MAGACFSAISAAILRKKEASETYELCRLSSGMKAWIRIDPVAA